MSRARETAALVRALRRLNPQALFEEGTRHWKVKTAAGVLAGIIPFTLREEGLSPNLKAQFRRHGIALPGDRP